MKKQNVWDLSSLYAGFDDPAFLSDLKSLSAQIAALDPAAPIPDWLEARNNVENTAERPYQFALLRMAADTDDEAATAYAEQIEGILADLSPKDAAFRVRLAQMPALPEAGVHNFYLQESQAFGRHSLSESEEAILAKLAPTGAMAWYKLQHRLTSTLTVPVNGQDYPLPAARNLAYSPDDQLRAAAYDAELAACKTIANGVAASLNGVKGEVLTVSKLRGYRSPLEETLQKSRLDREVLDALLAACRATLPDFRRYFRKKAQLLGKGNALPFSDLYAPMSGGGKHYTYEEAQDFILTQFGAFSPHLAAYAKRVFDNHWIDVSPRPGKQGGAFCTNLHCIGESRFLTNFIGSLNDVLTFAHELGHGFHGECLRNASPLNSDYPMPIAETASTFCEILSKQAALKTASPEEALAIREADISDSAQVIVDILSRFLFEDAVFAARSNGPLSADRMCRIMLDAQTATYGDALATQHPYMWLVKGHYYDPEYNYYNFPYAFGLLLAKGLYRLYREQKDTFPARYEKLLAASGAMPLADLAATIGLDLRSDAFWQTAVAEIRADIDAFCQL